MLYLSFCRKDEFCIIFNIHHFKDGLILVISDTSLNPENLTDEQKIDSSDNECIVNDEVSSSDIELEIGGEENNSAGVVAAAVTAAAAIEEGKNTSDQ